MPELDLTIGDRDGDCVIFGPLSVRNEDRGPGGSFDFIDAPIVIRASAGHWRLSDRSGIEPLALARLRDDLGTLRVARQGRVFFGDHDFGQVVELTVTETGVVHVTANNAAANVFDIEIGEIGWDHVDALTFRIDEIEQRLGSLTGHCRSCGVPSSAYYR